MNKHTPGPWTVVQPNDATLDVAHSSGDLRSVIARCYDEFLCPEHGGSLNANARLIAAAPDLLNMLQRLMDEVMVSEKVFGQLAPLTMEHCRNAIAKATLALASPPPMRTARLGPPPTDYNPHAGGARLEHFSITPRPADNESVLLGTLDVLGTPYHFWFVEVQASPDGWQAVNDPHDRLSDLNRMDEGVFLTTKIDGKTYLGFGHPYCE